MKKAHLTLLICLSCMALSNAQYYFGQNKIQPFNYDWDILATPHFDIYYYPEEIDIARAAAQIAEQTWRRYTTHFRFAPGERIPIILYSSPALFSETHTIPFIIPEGVGGFTEFIKGRVIMPYDGSMAHFEHILPHELVHVWQLHYNEFLHDAHELFFLDFPPLWFVEGQAEFLSQTIEQIDERTEIIASLANDRFVLPQYFYYISGTYQMYKEGESFLRFLTDEYGSDTDSRLFERIWEHGWFSDVFHATLGISLEDAGLLWRKWLRIKFGEYINRRTPAKVVGKEISPPGFFFSPVQLDSTSVVCKGNKMGYTGIYILEKGDASLYEKLELTESAEATRLFGNGIAIYGDSLLACSAKTRGTDRLLIFDLKSGKDKKFKWNDIVEINSPTFSSDGSKVAFSASELNGTFDIYALDLNSQELHKLTDDAYWDTEPAFLSDGSIMFVSDRNDKNKPGIFKLIPGRTQPVELVLPKNIFRPKSLSIADDGCKMLFVADDDTFPDIYMLDFAKDSLYRITKLSEPVYDVSWLGTDSLILSRNADDGVCIAKLEIDSSEFIGFAKFEPIEREKNWEFPQMAPSLAMGEDIAKPKTHRLTFDLAQGEVAMSSAQESAGGLEIMLSDMVGDRRLYIYFLESARKWDDILSDANIIAAYDKQGLRWGKTAGIYHLHLFSYDRYEGSYDERQAGIMAGARYALTRFIRVEGIGYLYYSDRHTFSRHREDGIAALNLSLIRDNSLWAVTGPIDGMRSNLTIGASGGVSGKMYHYLASLDLRHYQRLTQRTCWAHRLILRHSGGPEPQRFYMGGTWDFRGYPYFYFFGRNQALFNSELRFPLFDRIVIATPLIDIDISGLRGALFFDAGDAWEDEPNPVGSFGVGARMSLDGYIVLRFDIAQTTDFKTIDPHWRWDIFFGWDF